MPGEFVIRKEAVRRIGVSNLHALNNIDRPGRGSYGRGGSSKTQRFATGGMVAPTGPINGIKPGTRGWGMKLIRQLFKLPINGAGFDQNGVQDGWWNDLTNAYEKNNYVVPSFETASTTAPGRDVPEMLKWLNSFASGMRSTVKNIISTREMQKIVGTKIDGHIGRNTIEALKKYKSNHKIPLNPRNEWDFKTQRFMSMDRFPQRWIGTVPRLWMAANNHKQSIFSMAPWFNTAQGTIKNAVPAALNSKILWDSDNVGITGVITKSLVSALQRMMGASDTGIWGDSKDNEYSESVKSSYNMSDAIKYVLDKGLSRETASVFPPWWELSPIQQAIENSDKGNKNMAEFLKSLDTLSSWGLGYLVEDLQSQGVASGLPLAKSAVASRKLAEQHNEQLRRTKELEATGTEDYTKFVSTVLAPGPQLGIRKIAQAVGVADFAVVDMWKKLLKAGRLKAGSERTAALERDVRLFDRGVFYANTGGKVPGYGDSDTVPAMLTPGEFVLKKAAVKAIGLDNLYKMNGDTQYFANGGMVYNMNAVASRASVSDLGMVASNMKSNVSSRPIVENKTIVNNNTTINNPVREPSTKSMNKMLRRQAVLGGSVIGNEATTVNGEM